MFKFTTVAAIVAGAAAFKRAPINRANMMEVEDGVFVSPGVEQPAKFMGYKKIEGVVPVHPRTNHTDSPVNFMGVQISPPAPSGHAIMHAHIPSHSMSSSSSSSSSALIGRNDLVLDRTPKDYFCTKEGYVLSGTKCIKEISIPVKYVCPSGYSDQQSNQCVMKQSIINSCPEGYYRAGSGCKKIVTVETFDVCPEGTYANQEKGKCEKKVHVATKPVCNEGVLDNVNKVCKKTITVDAAAYCPEGLEFSESTNMCVKEVEHSCDLNGVLGKNLTAAEEAQILDSNIIEGVATEEDINKRGLNKKGEVLLEIKTGGGMHSRRLHESTPYNPASMQQSLAQISETVKCKVHTICTKVVSSPLIYSCAEGVLSNKKCLITEQLPVDWVCNAQGDSSDCYNLIPQPALKKCEEGFSLSCNGAPVSQAYEGINGSCKCSAEEMTVFNQSCASSFSMDVNGDGCVKAAEYNTVCPSGYTMRGDECVKNIEEEASCTYTVTYGCNPEIQSCNY